MTKLQQPKNENRRRVMDGMPERTHSTAHRHHLVLSGIPCDYILVHIMFTYSFVQICVSVCEAFVSSVS